MSMLDPIPVSDPFVERQIYMGERFYRWLSDLVARVLPSALTVAAVHRTGLSASVPTTTLFTPTTPGAVRVSLSVQVTTASGATSSIAGSLTWKANGVTQTETLAALVTNTTTTHDEISLVIYPDTAQPVAYDTTYASTGVPVMVYTVTATVETLQT